MTARTGKYTRELVAILKRAESASADEAEILTAQAQAMILEHSAAAARLAVDRPSNEQIVERELRATKKAYHREFIDIWHAAVAGMSNGVLDYKTSFGGTDVVYTIVGFKSDVDQMVLMLKSLELQATAAIQQFWVEHPQRRTMTPREAQVERNQFYHGFAQGVASRFRLVRATLSEADQEGMEMVVAKTEAVESYIEDTAVKRGLRRGRRPGGSVGRNYAGTRGFVAGKGAKLDAGASSAAETAAEETAVAAASASVSV